MQPIVREWIRRVVGYGGAAASGWVATRTGDPELGSAVAVVAAYVLNKAIPFLFPTTRKMIASGKPPLR